VAFDTVTATGTFEETSISLQPMFRGFRSFVSPGAWSKPSIDTVKPPAESVGGRYAWDLNATAQASAAAQTRERLVT